MPANRTSIAFRSTAIGLCLLFLSTTASASTLQPEGRIFVMKRGFTDLLSLGLGLSFSARSMIGWKFQHPHKGIPKVKQKPTLDGKLDDDIWKRATVYGRFVYPRIPKAHPVHTAGAEAPDEVPADRQTVVRMIHDGETLYIGAECSGIFKGKSGDHPQAARDNYSIQLQDRLEIYLDPLNYHQGYYRLMVGISGTKYDARFEYHRWMQPAWQFREAAIGMNTAWNPTWEAVTHRRDDGWSVEIAIPMKELWIDPVDGGPCGIAFARGNDHGSRWHRVEGTKMTYHPAPFFPKATDYEHTGTYWHHIDGTQFYDITFNSPIDVEKIDLAGIEVLETTALGLDLKNTTDQRQTFKVSSHLIPVTMNTWEQALDGGGTTLLQKLDPDIIMTDKAKKSLHSDYWQRRNFKLGMRLNREHHSIDVTLGPGEKKFVRIPTGAKPASDLPFMLRVSLSGEGRTEFYSASFYVLPRVDINDRPLYQDKSAYDTLWAQFSDPVWKKYRGQILQALGSIDAKRALPTALSLVSDPAMKGWARAIIGRNKSPVATAALIQIIETEATGWNAIFAAQTLAAWKDPDTAAIARRILERASDPKRNHDKWQRVHLAHTIGNLAVNGVEWAKEILYIRAMDSKAGGEGDLDVLKVQIPALRRLVTADDLEWIRKCFKSRVNGGIYVVFNVAPVEWSLDFDPDADMERIKKWIDEAVTNQLGFPMDYCPPARDGRDRVRKKYKERMRTGKPTAATSATAAKVAQLPWNASIGDAIAYLSDLEVAGYGWSLGSSAVHRKVYGRWKLEKMQLDGIIPMMEEWSTKMIHLTDVWSTGTAIYHTRGKDPKTADRAMLRILARRKGEKRETKFPWQPKATRRSGDWNAPWARMHDFYSMSGTSPVWEISMSSDMRESIDLAWNYKWFVGDGKEDASKPYPPEPFKLDHARFAFATTNGGIAIINADNTVTAFDVGGKPMWKKPKKLKTTFDVAGASPGETLKAFGLDVCAFNPYPKPRETPDAWASLPDGVVAGRNIVKATPLKVGVDDGVITFKVKPGTIYLMAFTCDGNTDKLRFEYARSDHQLDMSLTFADDTVLLHRMINYPGPGPIQESFVFSAPKGVREMTLTFFNMGLDEGHTVSKIRISPLEFEYENMATPGMLGTTTETFANGGSFKNFTIKKGHPLINGIITDVSQHSSTDERGRTTVSTRYEGRIENQVGARWFLGEQGGYQITFDEEKDVSIVCLFGTPRDYALEYLDIDRGEWVTLAAGINQRKNYQFISVPDIATWQFRFFYRRVNSIIDQDDSTPGFMRTTFTTSTLSELMIF